MHLPGTGLRSKPNKRKDSLTEVLSSILGKGIYLFEGRYSCTEIEVIRTELSLPARNEEARDAIRGQSNRQIEEEKQPVFLLLIDCIPSCFCLPYY